MTTTTEHCGNCAKTRTLFDKTGQIASHTTCGTDATVGEATDQPPKRCVCQNVYDETKPADCPGWVTTKMYICESELDAMAAMELGLDGVAGVTKG